MASQSGLLSPQLALQAAAPDGLTVQQLQAKCLGDTVTALACSELLRQLEQLRHDGAARFSRGTDCWYWGPNRPAERGRGNGSARPPEKPQDASSAEPAVTALPMGGESSSVKPALPVLGLNPAARAKFCAREAILQTMAREGRPMLAREIAQAVHPEWGRTVVFSRLSRMHRGKEPDLTKDKTGAYRLVRKPTG